VTEGTHLQLLQGNLVSRAVVAELDLFSHTSKVKKRGVAQLVARTAGGREAAGSSPVTPTMDLFLEIDEIKFLTDGGSRGNPGPAASSVVIFTMDSEIVGQFGNFLGSDYQ
jgi:hypothetical protein